MEAMIRYKKFCLVSIIIWLAIFINATSCHDGEKTTCNIRWVLLGDFKEARIELSFWGNQTEYQYILIPEKTKKITVPTGARFMAESLQYDAQMIIYHESLYITEKTMIEIYLYDPKVEWVNGHYLMEKQEGVEAYFVDYSLNGKVYTIVSADNVLTKTKEKTFENVNIIYEAIKTEDFHYYDELGFILNPDVPIGGYIVKSKLTNNYLWLYTRQL
jgi:hypothetical protein